MRSETKNDLYTVTRWCCTSGNCETCHAKFDKERRVKVTHADGVTQAQAAIMVANWRAYGATAKPDSVEEV